MDRYGDLRDVDGEWESRGDGRRLELEEIAENQSMGDFNEFNVLISIDEPLAFGHCYSFRL